MQSTRQGHTYLMDFFLFYLYFSMVVKQIDKIHLSYIALVVLDIVQIFQICILNNFYFPQVMGNCTLKILIQNVLRFPVPWVLFMQTLLSLFLQTLFLCKLTYILLYQKGYILKQREFAPRGQILSFQGRLLSFFQLLNMLSAVQKYSCTTHHHPASNVCANGNVSIYKCLSFILNFFLSCVSVHSSRLACLEPGLVCITASFFHVLTQKHVQIWQASQTRKMPY